jgi:hypothetical protein
VVDHERRENSLERAFLWDFERIVPGFGDVTEHGGAADFRSAWLS